MKVEAISKFREGIAAKFALFFSLLVLVATGTVGFMVYRGAEQSLINASIDRLKHTAEVIDVRLTAGVEAISKDLRFLAATPPVQGIVRAHVEGVRSERVYIDPQTNINDTEWRDQLVRTLIQFLENRPSYVAVSFIGLTPEGGHEMMRIEKREGRMVRVPFDSLQPRHDDAFFERATERSGESVFLSDIELTETPAAEEKVPLMRAITPVYASNGRVYGAIEIRVDARSMFETFTSLIGTDHALYLANEKGALLTASRADTLGTRFPAAGPWLDDGVKEPFVEQLDTEAGTSNQMAYFERVAYGMGPNRHRLVVGITSPYDAILARAKQVRTYSLVVTLLFGFIGIGLALGFSGYLTHPLRQVTRALSRFGRDGDESYGALRLPTNRKDEIGVLARTFNAMKQQIKRQMHELVDKEHRQRIILETSAEGIIVVSESGRIETFNPAAETLFGRKAGTVVGTSIDTLLDVPDEVRPDEAFDSEDKGRADAFDADNDPSWLPPWKQVGSGREVTGRRADGTTTPLSLAVSAFELFGEQKYAIFLQDISKRKRYERILQEAKEKAEEVAQLKSTFLANMSHEIRTPLTTVIGYAGVLAEEASDKHREFAEFIRSSGERLMETLNSVLSMAQLEASGVEIQLDVLNVTEEAREVTALFQPLADDKALDLRFEPPSDDLDGPMAPLDRGALSSILQNLIGNAIKFTETGGVTVRVTCDVHEVHLHVIDTGIGMDESFLPRLFDEFVQESSGVRRSHEGSGLGLAITKRLVDLMDGRIAVESTKGEGTEFIVSFPRAGSPAFAREDPVRDAQGDTQGTSAAAKLLLVEDNPETASLMQELLQPEYDVAVATDGESALRRAQEGTYDGVLLDINLGDGSSGVDVLRRLRAQPAYTDVPIAAVTAYALPGDRERFLKMGFDGYLDKPFAPEDLVGLVAQLLAMPTADAHGPREARSRAHPRTSDTAASETSA